MMTHETSVMSEAQAAHNTLVVSGQDHRNSPHIVCPVIRAVRIKYVLVSYFQSDTNSRGKCTWNLMSRVVAAP
jgi:hypothetical protein